MLLTQQTRWVGGKQENEENHPPRIQENIRLFGVILSGYVEGQKEWMESFKIFGIGKEDGKKIIQRLGLTLLSELEKLFDSYWCHTLGSPSGLLKLLGKGISVRVSGLLREGKT